jgi:photosystem II stability/assembly factor-like uncharacterized protein
MEQSTMSRIAVLLTIVSELVVRATVASAAEPQAGPASAASAAQAAAGPPMFVAVGYALRRMTSRDGLTWLDEQAAPEHGQDKNYLLRGVAYGQGKIVAVGGSRTSRILVSDDHGRTWRDVSLQENFLSDVAFGNGRFVAVGYRGALHSADGVAWSKPTAVGGVSWRRVEFAAGKFVAIGAPGRAGTPPGWRATSVDGEGWDPQPLADDGVPHALAYGGGRFVVVGENGLCETSDDGIEWQRRALPEGAGSLTDLVWTGREFLASDGRATFRSADGAEWTKFDARMPSRSCFGGGRFVGCSAGRFSTSSDARTWTPVDTAHRQQVTKIIYVPAP